jgi:hypothetical protein
METIEEMKKRIVDLEAQVTQLQEYRSTHKPFYIIKRFMYGDLGRTGWLNHEEENEFSETSASVLTDRHHAKELSRFFNLVPGNLATVYEVRELD